MQCFRRCLLAILAVLAIGVAAVAGTLFVPAPWLSSADEPVPSSAIVVLGGDPSRALAAADLHRQGLAPRVLVSAPIRLRSELRLEAAGVVKPREEDLARQVLLARGVPESAIGIFGRDLSSTLDEARALHTLLGTEGTLLVVTSPLHVRRARIVFATEFPLERFRVIGSRYDPVPEKWWRDRESARDVLLEVAKLAYFVVGGRF